MRPTHGHGDGNQIADGARPHALLLVMVTLVAVVALTFPAANMVGDKTQLTKQL
jgi:hypothetical protein